MSRESDKSLLSVDGSENEEEDQFDASWKSKVAGVATKDSPKEESDMDLDFAAVKVSEAPLKSDAAKHKLSVRPKSRKISKKMYKEKSASAPLPKLSEESPTKTPPALSLTTEETEETPPKKEEEVKEENKLTAEDVTKEEVHKDAIDIPVSKGASSNRFGLSSSPVNQSLLNEMKVKKRPGSIKAIEDMENRRSVVSPESADNTEFSQIFSKFNNRLSFPAKDEEAQNGVSSKSPVSHDNKIITITSLDKADDGKMKTVLSLSESSNKSSDVTKSDDVKSPVSLKDSSVFEKKTPTTIKVSQKASSETTSSDDTKSKQPMGSKVPANTKVDTDVVIIQKSTNGSTEKPSPPESDKPATKVAEKTVNKSPVIQPKPISISEKAPHYTKLDDQKPASNKLTSPKEDYKQKRQGRSKTLPEHPVPQDIIKQATSVANDSSSKVQRSNSQGCELESSASSKVESAVTSVENKSVPKKLDGLKSAFQDSSSSSEPEWIKLARKKQPETESPPKETGVQKKESPSETKSFSVSKGSFTKPDSKKIEISSLNNSTSKQNTKIPEKKIDIVKQETSKTTSKETVTITKTESAVKTPSKPSGTVSSFTKKNSLTSSNGPKPVEILKKTEDKKTSSDKQESTVRKNSSAGISKTASVSGADKPSSVSSVPAWRRDLPGKKKDVNIEIIEKTDSGKSKEKPSETPTVQLRDKSKMESSKCTDTSANRSSVLDMVKSFQKLQVS